MQTGHIALSTADAATIESMAAQIGVDSGVLIRIAAHALAQHIRHTQQLTLPITIAPATLETALQDAGKILQGQFG